MAEPGRQEVVRRVRELLARYRDPAQVDGLGDDEPLAVLGIDSVTLITVAAELHQRWDVTIADDAVLDPAASVASLAAAAVAPGGAGDRTGGRLDVVGMGVVAPTGLGVPALWDGLLAERAHRLPMPYDAARGHRAGAVAGASAAEVVAPDRLLDLVCLAAGEALGGLDPGRRAGVTLVVGTTDTGGNALGHALAGAGDDQSALAGWVAERAAEQLGLGAAVTVGSASASGAVALGYARDLLLAGDAEEALVVGADTVSKSAFHGLAALRTLGVDGCQPFHEARRGIALSEAAAACLLRRPVPGDDAVLGRLAGYGASSFTTHMAAPESAGIELALRRALAAAALAPGDVSFVNAHGPGTKLGDVAEMRALADVFGDRVRTLPINSVKGLLWHCQGAAGVIESLACLLSLRHGTLTPTTAAEPVDPQWREFDIVTKPRELADARSAVSVSCGLGGVNTAVVWERA
ncbi:beta-ketoacyl synthase N-terminal-like domain-containing protein [Micromonospora sp. WMMD956]|jgi:3-oxoacyl-[acyl-carrier-protein] synthase II|uniref:beta-ketoacyl synthase N-terminal-like domain-containing protein n=1 Tax=Micromonospora TaxID=1873 RepID=UPI002417E2D4|nr:beta-ketoacyl synthase N-terminal-like domain-containing protein [Micromonospora sp. WMMD956]MDG4818971.1 beta-ketoacyl synthase N-terminal-like domain-containing protein [Micromonospora sp. WMMD956]